jgi:hypothetical protein
MRKIYTLAILLLAAQGSIAQGKKLFAASSHADTSFTAGVLQLTNPRYSTEDSSKVLSIINGNVVLVDRSPSAASLPSGIDAAKIANGSVSNTEFQYLDGVTSALQTQLDGKASLSGSYSNPSWITSLGWSKITSTPTTLFGYGITDAAPTSGSVNYIQNQYTAAQDANYWINGKARSNRGLFGDSLEQQFKVIIGSDSTNPTKTVQRSLSIIQEVGYTDADSVASRQSQALVVANYIRANNTKKWTPNAFGHPNFYAIGASAFGLLGSTGTIPYAAAYYGSLSPQAAGLTFDRSAGLNLTYAHTGTINYCMGIDISDYDAGTNNTGIFMHLIDATYPPPGNHGIYETVGYPHFFTGELNLGSATDVGNFQLQNTGSAYFSDLVSIGTSSPTDGQVLNVTIPSTSGAGTITVSASGTTVSGTSTTFTKTFQIGQTITSNSESHIITAIASDVSMTTDAWTGACTNCAYTITSKTSILANENGGLNIGDGVFSSGNIGIYNTLYSYAPNIPGANSTKRGVGVLMTPVKTASGGTTTTTALFGTVVVSNSNTQALTTLVGADVAVSGGSGSGTVTDAIAYRVNNMAAASNPYTNAYNFKGVHPSGTITNSYGIWMPVQTIGGTSNVGYLYGAAPASGSYGAYFNTSQTNYFGTGPGLFGTATSPGNNREIHVLGQIGATDTIYTSTLFQEAGITSSVLKTNSSGVHAAAVAGTDYVSPQTTLAGYGITDAVPTSRTVNGYALSSNITLAFTDISGFASSTYSPTLTAVANVSASTAYVTGYFRSGSSVTVYGKFDVDATLAASTQTELGISLPIASNFTGEEDLGGDASTDAVASMVARIKADATNDRASVVFKALSITNDSYNFQFSYQIK